MFRALWVGSTVSNLGDGIRLAALPLLAEAITGSPALIAGLTSAQYTPWLVFGPVGGALVDRWRRRETILVVQTLRALVMVSLALVVVADRAAIWQLYVVAALITAGEILVDPAVGAVVPTVVPTERLEDANSRTTSAELVANELAGAPVGALAFAWVPGLPFVLDALSYGLSTLPFSRLPTTARRRRRPVSGLRSEIAEGARWLARHPVQGPMTASVALFNLGWVFTPALLVVLTQRTIGLSEPQFGLVLTAGAVGGVLGAALAGRTHRRFGRRATVVAGAALQALVTLAVAGSSSPLALVVLWFLSGIPMGLLVPVLRALQQRLTPTELLGRVNTASRTITRGAMMAGATIAGVVAEATTTRAAIASGAAVQAVGAALLWIALGRLCGDGDPPVGSMP